MSSTTPLRPQDFEHAVGGAIAFAVSTVAERSFFACVDRGDEPDLDDISADWFVATIRFDDGPVCGSLTCSLPLDLGLWLFDAFTGRDPATPLPQPHQLDDLVGEFANMVCGTWLTRCEAHRVFRLSPPAISRVAQPVDDGSRHREWVLVNNRPVAIDWDLAPSAGDATAARPGL
jgi:hypothetical protein